MAHTETDDDPLAALRERIRTTAAAADRMAQEAGGDSERDRPGASGAASEATREVQALAGLVGLLRDLLPDDLRRQVSDLIRQVLLLVRAVIDLYLLRLEPARGEEPAPAPIVVDIPLD